MRPTRSVVGQPLPEHLLLGVPASIFDPMPSEQQAGVDAWKTECARITAQTLAAAQEPALTPAPARATLADALVRLAERALQTPSPIRTLKSRLTVQIDQQGELLPPVSMKDVMQTLPGRARLRRLHPSDPTRHDAGRDARHPSHALRELLGTLDGERCRFPGCTRTHKLHAHHVLYWTNGGGTDLHNLILVCSRHHTLIHAQGFQLTLHPDRTLSVTTTEGVAVLHHPALPWRPAQELDPTGDVSAETLPPQWNGDRLNLDHAVWVLMQQAA
ncbi:MAG: endonuclease [Frankiales bacterium]|nr:endonuclease [Frankiales bacterium]